MALLEVGPRNDAQQRQNQITTAEQLPPLTKADLMAHSDAWVTNPAITRPGVGAFIADPSLVGQDYLGRYVVCTTSGSTGTPALLLHDQGALVVYNVPGYVRSLPVFFSSPRTLWALLRGGSRLTSIFVTGAISWAQPCLPAEPARCPVAPSGSATPRR